MDADTFPVLLVYPSSRNIVPSAKVAHKLLVAEITKYVKVMESENARDFTLVLRFRRVKYPVT
jgi:hypothetical protein